MFVTGGIGDGVGLINLFFFVDMIEVGGQRREAYREGVGFRDGCGGGVRSYPGRVYRS